MKLPTVIIGLVTAAALYSTAEARPVTLNTTLKKFGGGGAYLAIYVTDSAGKVKSTLVLTGSRPQYFKHLRDWRRGGPGKKIDGVTGASVGSGRSLKVSVDIADALIDAGFQIHIDSSVEDGRDNPSEVVTPLESGSAGIAVAGKGYVKSFRFDM